MGSYCIMIIAVAFICISGIRGTGYSKVVQLGSNSGNGIKPLL